MKINIKIVALYSVVVLLAALPQGCIKNDIPYPRIQPNIIELEVENQMQSSQLDTVNRVATVYLTEIADITDVKVIECKISDGASFVGPAIEGSIDLTNPKDFTLMLYQEYVWTVRAVQNIDRYFTVSNQIGSTVIDVPGHRVVVTLPDAVDLHSVKVLTAKLGSSASAIIPSLAGNTVDLSAPLEVEVSDYGRTERWAILAEVTQSNVTTVRVDAWTEVAWVYGEAQEGKDNTIEYRRAESQAWIRVPQEWLTVNGGSFNARILHLDPLTDYVARAVSDNEYGLELEFRTGSIVQPQDASFDDWWLDGKVWCPWAEDSEPYWGTGNKGATTLGNSNTVPTDDTSSGTGKAAMLETRFVGIGALGKLAAGNIFAGYYVRTEGTDGVLSFGRDFKERPTRLTGYMKYHSALISHSSSTFTYLKNRPDTCIIWAALIDSSQPFEVRTKSSDRHLFDPDADDVIAYGKVEYGYDVESYQQFDFELNYKDTNRVPNYILIVASASKYGDYFTGGNGSILYIDDLKLLYDY